MAAVWCIINWTWVADGEDEDGRLKSGLCTEVAEALILSYFIALIERINRLKALGVEQKLKAMERDPSRDVRDRVRTALDQLTSYSP